MMELKGWIKRIFCAGILALMTVLAVGTVVAVAEGEEDISTSYSLIIKKVLDEGSPDEAYGRGYQFKIQGITKIPYTDEKGDTQIREKKVNEIVTVEVGRKGDADADNSKRITFLGPTEITVVELTDDVPITDRDGFTWNMGKIEKREVKTVGQWGYSRIDISEDGGSIRIERPDSAKITYFKVVGRAFSENEENEDAENVIYESGLIPVGPKSEGILEDLPRGSYTIEEMKAPDGFEIVIGPREVEVAPGETGTVHINGDSGILTIHAPGDESSSEVYCYTIKRAEEDEKEVQNVEVRSGTVGKTEPLSAGTYTVFCTGIADEPEMDTEISSAFRITVEEKDSTTDAAYDMEILGDREITISKPKGEEEDGGRTYEFAIFELKEEEDEENDDSQPDDEDVPQPLQTITLKAEEEMAPITLPAGKYRVKAVDDNFEAFELSYSDSSTLEMNTAAWGKAIFVTFTNTFKREEGSYRVIHEYYRREGDRYIYEGSSDVRTIRAQPINDSVYHQADEVGLETMYDSHKYTPMGFAYGRATPSNAVRSQRKATSGNALLTEKTISHNMAMVSGQIPDEEESPGSSARECDKDGIIVRDIGYGTDKEGYSYERVDEMTDGVRATKDGEEIIIRRYVREGSYKVVHTYYWIDKDGKEHFEGRSGIETVKAKIDKEYDDGDVTKIPTSEATGKEYKYRGSSYGTVTVGVSDDSPSLEDPKETLYKAESEKTRVTATAEGNEIIILKYVRQGSYKVVHTYYRVDKDGKEYFEERSGIKTVKADIDQEYDDNDVTKIPISEITGKKYEYRSSSYGTVEKGVSDDNATVNDPGDSLYKAESGKTQVEATEKGDQIIILKYVRTEPETPPPDIPKEPTGTYKVVHTYYLRDESGDHFEGRSKITAVEADLDDKEYTEDDVAKIPVSEATKRKYEYETSAYGHASGNADNDAATTQDPGNTLYEAESGKTWAKATEKGDQIIILKYIRTEPETPPPDIPEEPTGTYKVVHTYYLRDKSGDHFEGRSKITAVEADLDGKQYTSDSVTKVPVSEATGKEYSYELSTYGHTSGNTDNDAATTQDPGDTLYRAESGKTWVEATESGDEIMILKYIRTEPEKPEEPTEPETPPPDTPEEPAGTYKVVHTYYLRDETGDHFEGRSKITTIKADLDGSRYTSDSVEKIPTSEATGKKYAYETSVYGHASGNTDNDAATTQDPGDTLYRAESGKTWAEATESGSQIIILKYVRTEPEKPEEPTEPETPAAVPTRWFTCTI